MKLACCLMVVAALPGPVRAGPPAPVRIMPLGDSITQGQVRFGSYRRPLWLMLQQAGYTVDFVGSRQRQRGGGPRTNDYDPDHEGHWGWSLDKILPQLPAWLARARPEVVLLHLGTNDAMRGEPLEQTVGEWFSVLRLVHANNPDVRVLVARLIPVGGMENDIARLNQAMAAAWSNQPIPGLDVQWVDQFTGFSPEEDTWDGIHPNHQGDRKIATRWFEALRTVLPPPIAPAALPE